MAVARKDGSVSWGEEGGGEGGGIRPKAMFVWCYTPETYGFVDVYTAKLCGCLDAIKLKSLVV